MKKGLSRIIVGILFIVIQLFGLTGNAKSGVEVQLSFESLSLFIYDLMYIIGYYFVGILGAAFLISGIVARYKGDSDSNPPKDDAASTLNTKEDTEDLKGFTIPLSITMPILIAIFVVLFVAVLILERI